MPPSPWRRIFPSNPFFMTPTIPRAAIAGIGGFGASHHESMLLLEDQGKTRLLATCDPRVAELQELCERFKLAERGVRIYTDFDEMLAEHGSQLELANISTPIRAHAPMHAACIERGISCYLEKPPTLDPGELERMIEADSHAKKATQVGFIYISQPSRLELKRQILDGQFGRLLRVGYEGLWRRSHSYFSRNNWAGRLQMGDYILLDSCCGNAMSHHLHNILFFAGQSEVMNWALPGRVEAELYRANCIEGTDTVFARGELENGIEFRVAASHAWGGEALTREILTFENAEVIIQPGRDAEIRYADGRHETRPAGRVALVENLELYLNYLNGGTPRPITQLSDCRAFVALNALFYIAASRITTVQAPYRTPIHVEGDSSPTEVIDGIDRACTAFLKEGRFPSETGLPWAAGGGSADASALKALRQTLAGLRAG